MRGVSPSNNWRCGNRQRRKASSAIRFIVYAIGLAVLSGAWAQANAQVASKEFYPVWILVPTGNQDETVTLQKSEYLTLFKLRPMEGYALVDPVEPNKGKQLLPVGTQLIRVPGSRFVACEAIRPHHQGNFTCLLDENNDGNFDSFYRIGAGTDIFVEPVQFYDSKYKPLFHSARYRDIDEKSEFRSREFIMQYQVQGKLNIINFCFEPYRDKSDWGDRYVYDDCLVMNLTQRRDQPYPISATIKGSQVTAMSFDTVTKAMTFHVRRNAAESEIIFPYE